MSAVTEPQRTLLLTGGTSALGWAVACRLAAAGDGVLLAVRKPSRRRARERIAAFRAAQADAAGRIRLVSCDLGRSVPFDARTLERILADCSGVVHLAADRRPDVSREAQFDLNVGATRALLDLAGRLPALHRFVHVSDTTVSGDARGVWMEGDLLRGQGFAGDPVPESRLLAERHVRRAADSLNALVVRTVLPAGLRPGRPDAVMKLVARARNLAALPIPGLLRRFPLVPGARRRVHVLPVGFVADLIAAAWSSGTPGTTVHAADPFAPTLWEWLAHLSAALGLGTPGPGAPQAIDLLDAEFPARDVLYDTSIADALAARVGLVRPDWREGIAALIGSEDSA